MDKTEQFDEAIHGINMMVQNLSKENIFGDKKILSLLLLISILILIQINYYF